MSEPMFIQKKNSNQGGETVLFESWFCSILPNSLNVINKTCAEYINFIAVPAGGEGGATAPPSFEDLGKIKIFLVVRKKYLGKTIIFRAAIRKIWAKSGNLER